MKVPAGLTLKEAAGVFITFPTSYAGLVLRADLKAGETCLVHAGAGGVGIVAVQIAKALGATVIATAGSAEKTEVARRYGADHTINYREDEDWVSTVKELTNGRGADVIYDPVGLAKQSTRCVACRSAVLCSAVLSAITCRHVTLTPPPCWSSCIAWNGRYLVVGFAAGSIPKVALNRVLLKNISLVGLHWGAYVGNEPEAIPAVWKGINDMIASGKVCGECLMPTAAVWMLHRMRLLL